MIIYLTNYVIGKHTHHISLLSNKCVVTGFIKTCKAVVYFFVAKF